jgi:hypothetical protein
MYMFLPSLTAAAFDSGKRSFVVSIVQLPVSGLKTSIDESRFLPSYPPKIYIFPQQAVAAKAHLGTLRPLIAFHYSLKMS